MCGKREGGVSVSSMVSVRVRALRNRYVASQLASWLPWLPTFKAEDITFSGGG